MSAHIRSFQLHDKQKVLDLWNQVGIYRPWLDLASEIDEKLKRDPELFLVAADAEAIVGAVMGAYDGRRGWMYHLAVTPGRQRQGVGRQLLIEVERRMKRAGVQKINLQVRADNLDVVAFYQRVGYGQDELVSMSKVLRPKVRSHGGRAAQTSLADK